MPAASRPLPFEEAVRLVRERVAALAVQETPLRSAFGRFLAEPILASHPVPHFASSMMDGFAVRAADVAAARPDRPVELRLIGEIPAGSPGRVTLAPGTCARIMTGAPVPDTADAVVMLEVTESSGERVRVRRSCAAGDFIRRAGEDVCAGERVLSAGVHLGAAELGVLASLGCAHVQVRRRPRVAVLVTGDELLGVEDELAPGRIRSSNDVTLAGQVWEAGGELVALPKAGDDPRDLLRSLKQGKDADVLLTSGGVSVGDRDRVKEALAQLGFELVFWRVAVSPGKPLVFGTLGRTLVFGLPGNPVSSMVSFENFVRPVLLRQQGAAYPERPRVRAKLLGTITGPADRRHFARVRATLAADGVTVREVRPLGSGNLSSMVRANALAVLPEGKERAEEKEWLETMLMGDVAPAAVGGA
jgi:molybdopterin molybdotransferase